MTDETPHLRAIVLWLPRADEHALAASLGLCEPDPDLCARLVDAARIDCARRFPGVTVRVIRAHVWRMVRTLHRLGLTNTPDARSAAAVRLALDAEESRE